ncbi:3309_t:CDS:2, partial [Racocetra fulgida]
QIEFTTSSSSTNYALYKNAVAGRELLSSIFAIIEENASADGIMNIITLFINQKGLDIAKLRHFGSDEA